MGNQYRRIQTVKHALQYYITRPGASEKHLELIGILEKMQTTLKSQEKSLLLILEQMIHYSLLRGKFPLIAMKMEI